MIVAKEHLISLDFLPETGFAADTLSPTIGVFHRCVQPPLAQDLGRSEALAGRHGSESIYQRLVDDLLLKMSNYE